MSNLKLTSGGSLVLGSNAIAALSLNFITHSFLQNTELEVAFLARLVYLHHCQISLCACELLIQQRVMRL